MTLIAAFKCNEGTLIAADREETTGTAKRSIRKIRPLAVSLRGVTVIAASAGNAATADVALERLEKQISDSESIPIADYENLIRKAIVTVYRDYIWKNPDRDRDELDFSLLVSVTDPKSRQSLMYRTAGIVPQPIQAYVCIGSGEDFANYFADRLYHRAMDRRELIMLAGFIFREAKQAVRYVGQGTDLCFVFNDGGAFHVMGDLERLEDKLPSFAGVVQKFWKDTKVMPEWLHDPRLDLGRMSRLQQGKESEDSEH